ncbi:MAG TPA: glycosyltransferase family 4 protein [Burkholderiaceae bacterium]|nr:glycosyltransferase family 4 protein [Burkholderiaceae bacterium]
MISGGLAWSANEAMLRARHRLGCSSDWGLILSRNSRFDRFARRHVGNLLGSAKGDGARALFAYSYACTTVLEVAADRGCRAVMGQIDGGPVEEQIVLDEMSRHPELKERYRPAPPRYWQEWRRQCSTAHRIIVNSPWARECLERAGVDVRKAVTVPLYFETALDPAPRPPVRRFDDSRRLEVLFLGQLNLRKGAARLFDAVRQLRSDPVRFTVVGPASVQIPDDVLTARNFTYVGRVERADVGRYYEAADVMILPTLSDGFALTQLEAQAYGLPIIASAFCGEVVTDGVNGLVLPEVTGAAIASSIRRLIAQPDELALMSSRCVSSFRNIREYAERLVREAIG